MNCKLLTPIIATWLAGSFFPVTVYAQGFGGPDGADPGAGQEKPAPKPRPRWQQPLKLPEQYRAKDKDKDGQIGLYEWDRRDFATFRKLDLNHDGFLTAEELTRKPSSTSSRSFPGAPVVRTEASSRPASPLAAGPTTAAETPVASAADAATVSTTDKRAASAGDEPATATTPATGAGRSDAERQWDLLDKDKDGKVSEAEWGKSFLTRKKFTDAGIAVTFPMTQEEFSQLYSQLPGTGK
ncbi:MAG: hypothetical protein ACM3U2_13665 [Deltaproteobacteria bacterium]